MVDIKEYHFKLPLGSWPADKKLKEVGSYNLVLTDQGLEGYATYLFTNVLGWYVLLFPDPRFGKRGTIP